MLRCLPSKFTKIGTMSLMNYSQGAHSLPPAPQIATLTNPEDTSQARAWISNFKTQIIPRAAVELSFSRSSGPGGQNIDDCLSKLHDIILKASLADVKNEPSEEQKKRVASLERAEKARRRQEKSYRSDVKKGRSKGDWD
ncbi:hypothetical protein H0H87_011232 [Tephrocybe sp. NHM501043]|nr:hypothetical protein H0H87_011232 [Tephrocybe sp. NHM501043]